MSERGMSVPLPASHTPQLTAQQAEGSPRLEEHMSCQLVYSQAGAVTLSCSQEADSHAGFTLNVATETFLEAAQKLSSLLNSLWPGRRLFSARSTWVQARALPLCSGGL